MLQGADSLRVPAYRRHKPTGQAVVTLNGKDFYLGRWGTKASRAEYDRLIGEWLASGRALPKAACDLTVAELAVRYLEHAQRYYIKNGQPTGSIPALRVALRWLRQTYGPTLVIDFGPLALEAVQGKMISADLSRHTVNELVAWIRRAFRWGVAKQLVPPTVYQALQALPGLRRGYTTARETAPVKPVADAVVDATVPHLPEVVADIVALQRLTGCRPAEVCILRPCDVDTSGDVWVYRPESHKTEHHGRDRVICIGPKAQDVLRPYLLRDKTAYCFNPIESEKKRRAEQHARRVTPLGYGNRPGTNRTRKPKRSPGDCYTPDSYRRAIHRAVDAINAKRQEEAAAQPDGQRTEPALLPRWSPNRLRHTAATAIRKQFGLEAAQVALGHATADVSQIYAERDLTLAVEVMRKIG